MKSSNNIHKKEYVITKAEYDKLTEAYNKCQKDMADKKYTEEDIRKAITFGQGIELWKEENQIEDYINSLKKQD